MAVLEFLKSKLLRGHERSVRAKKNIAALFGLKGYSVAVSLALIPLTLNILDEYQYGVWITLFNVLSWISIFDIGIGNGLRNKFAEAIAQGKLNEAREYVSTAYFLMFGISICLVVVFVIPWMMVDWSNVFNVPAELSREVFFLIGISFLLTSIQFSLKLIGTLLTANHQPALSAFLGTISNTVVLLVLWLGKDFFVDSLFAVGFAYTGIPLLVFLGSTFYFFNKQFKHVSPKRKYFKKNKVSSLFSLGMQYFVIQIAVVVIFSTDSMIITHMLSPKDVTPYNIVFRYFGVVTLIAGIIMTPFWSAYTEAAAKNDYAWIRSIVKNQLKAMLLVIALALLLFAVADRLIPLWLQYDIEFSFALLLGMSIYSILSVWSNIFAFLLNGLSKPFLSSILSVFAAIVNIPISIFFITYYEMGNAGVIYGTLVSLSIGMIMGPIQAYKVINGKAKGIWNR